VELHRPLYAPVEGWQDGGMGLHRGWAVAALLCACSGTADSEPLGPGWLSAQRDTTCLLRGGDVTCWGENEWSGVDISGDDRRDPAFTWPITEVGGVAVDVDVGDEHSCAVLDDGAVVCWGEDEDGQLGGEKRRNQDKIRTTVDAPFVSVSAGNLHTCAITDLGELWCWGEVASLGVMNGFGKVMLDVPVVAVVAGNRDTCVLLEGGAVRCWEQRVEPGEGLPANCRSEPACPEDDPCCVDLLPHEIGDIDLGGPAVEIVMSGSHRCARLEDGQVRCWGYNTHGRLGLGHTERIGDDETPAIGGRVPLDAPAIALATENWRTCAVLDDGAVRCWGEGTGGVLGIAGVDDIGDDESILDVPAIPLEQAAEHVALGRNHACALMHDGDVRCWGDPRGNVLGNWPELDHCNVEEPNPSVGALCEPETIYVFRCEAERSCCIGDDESAASAIDVPL